MKIYKNRWTCVIMTMLLVLVTLVGCGDNANNGQKAESYAYDYEQELNIIDDNYRNYYEIFVYSFYDSDGDGIGDLRGVTEKLDYIQEMGFNGIWLMPIMPSTTYHKYDVIDYKDIDPEYGTLEDFQELVDECHERDIRLIIDFVINHSSAQNQWFLEACDYLRTLEEGEEPDVTVCPYVDYYHFSTEKIDSTYYGVAGVDWWYEGSFWDQMPDLNLESEALRGELEDIAKFWIDMGVDGFRMDAALHFEEEDADANNEILNWIYDYGKSLNPDFYMVSEVWASEKTITDYYGSLTPSMFNFDAASAEGKIMKAARNGSAVGFVQAMLRYQEDFSAVNPEYIDAPFLTNHDQVRVANALTSNPDNMKMAAGLLMTMSGSPFVYYGEEIGMKSSGTKDENKRLPMRWSETDDTGMTKGPSGSDKNAEQTFAALDEQLSDPDSIVNYYRRALRIRNENPEIARGTITLVEELSEGNQAAITKTYEGSTIGILYNTAVGDATMNLQGTALEGMEIRGYMTLHGEVVTLENDEVALPAQSICILK